jgi:hypothetical protein
MKNVLFNMERWVVCKMTPGIWYPVKQENIEIMKQIDLPAHELTFDKEYKRVKLTLWENGEPII